MGHLLSGIVQMYSSLAVSIAVGFLTCESELSLIWAQLERGAASPNLIPRPALEGRLQPRARRNRQSLT